MIFTVVIVKIVSKMATGHAIKPTVFPCLRTWASENDPHFVLSFVDGSSCINSFISDHSPVDLSTMHMCLIKSRKQLPVL
jgi:hypothetical protein